MGNMKKILQILQTKKNTIKNSDSGRKQQILTFMNRYSLVLHMILACFLCFMIEWFSRHSFVSAFQFMIGKTTVFLYNSLIVFATFLIVYFFKKRAQIRITLSALWLFLGIVNGCVLAARVTPFNFADIKLVGDLFAMKSNYFSNTQAGIVIAGVLAFLILDVLLFIKGPSYEGRVHRFVAALSVASAFVWLPFVTEAAVSSNVITNYFDNIAAGYRDYGFVYGFSSSVVDRGMEKPDTYTKDEIERLLADTRKEAGTTDMKGKSPNVILVLLESFIDPSEVNYLKTSTDPIPYFHELEKEYTTGYLDVPVVGAGTANTEFEMLTGMSMRYFGTGEYPYKTILKSKSCESVADIFAKNGYKTHVVHNNTAKFYSRNNAFAKMGFDSFTSKEFMNIKEYTPLGTWPTDDILINEVKKAMDATKESDFVYTITVQGHGAYPEEKVIEDPEVMVAGSDTVERNNAWEYYVNEIHEVDKFIANLTKMLDERGEDTMVVLFGDHLPSMELTESDMKSGNLFFTKYVTWNNFGLPKHNENLTSYQLMSDMMGRIGIHDGTILSYHQANHELSRNNEAYQKGLENLQYDLLYGQRYSYHGLDLYPESDLEMGVADIVLSGYDLKSAKEVEILENLRQAQAEGGSVSQNTILSVSANSLPVSANSVSENDLEQYAEAMARSLPAAEVEQEGLLGSGIPAEQAPVEKWIAVSANDTISANDAQEMEKKKKYTDRVYLYGDNYTPWSKVFVNDSKISTQFIDEHTLSVKASDLKNLDPEDELTVNQMGGSTILRSSNSIKNVFLPQE